jgi:hypothetical protein
LFKAFVLGNGLSRSDIDITKLKKHGKVYGCNAIYREMSVDYLIAVDTKMINEIVESKYHLTNPVWTNPNSVTQKIKEINLFKPSFGWSSGPTALHLASTHGYEDIYILGFDYVGTGPNRDFVNNMYAGSKNYKKVNDLATYYGNWLKQTATCINQNPKTKYFRVVEEDSFIPKELSEIQNLFHISKEKFIKSQ